MTSRLLNLRDTGNWNPEELLRPAASELWPASSSLVRLSELASVIGEARPGKLDQPVVTPGCIDVTTGAVRRTRRDFSGAVRTVGLELRPGDVLVPTAGRGPALLLSEDHVGYAFSTSFIPLRSEDYFRALWLWACLSSESGRSARASAATGGMASQLRVSPLLALEVPSPPPIADPLMAALGKLAESLTAIAPAGDTAASWWRLVRLPADGQWRWDLALRDPAVLREGTPLEQLAEIVPGRTPRAFSSSPLRGLLPVRQGNSIDGQRVSKWALPETAPDLVAGDILVVEVGERGRVAVCNEPGLAGNGVYRVRLHDRGLIEHVATYLASEAAQALRGSLVTGSFIPRLAPSVLRAFPVPHQPVATSAPPVPARDLASRLQELLWP